jgi:hypothetical protein
MGEGGSGSRGVLGTYGAFRLHVGKMSALRIDQPYVNFGTSPESGPFHRRTDGAEARYGNRILKLANDRRVELGQDDPARFLLLALLPVTPSGLCIDFLRFA